MNTYPIYGINFVDILTDFYCSLPSDKDIQKLTSEISQFVINRQAKCNKQELGKQILQYFLNLYSKYKMNNDQQWDSAFQLSTAKDRAISYIAQFPQRKMLEWGIQKIKQNNLTDQLYSETIFTQLSGNQATLYDEIQVEQDVKIKTKYFFKWCLYLKSAKNFKQMKMKTVHNMKMSQCFNTYGTKFNYFTAWKMLAKKRKSYRQKSQQISILAQKRILSKCLCVIHESGQILLFEEQLSSLVKNKLDMRNRVKFFKYLKMNKQFMKCLQPTSFKKNIYAHKFIDICSKGLKTRMNLSYKTSRTKFQQDFQLCQMKKIFQTFKNKIYIKQNKMMRLKKLKINHGFVNLLMNLKSQQTLIKNKTIFYDFLCVKKKKISLTLLHFNMLVKKQQKTEQMLQQNSKKTMDCRIVDARSKKKLIQANKQYLEVLKKLKRQSFFKKIKNIAEKTKIAQCNSQQIINLFKKRFFINNLHNKKLLLKRSQIVKFSIQQNHRLLSIKMFKRWLKIKQANQVQKNVLTKLSQISNRKLQQIFITKLLNRATERDRLQILSNKIQFTILKLSFGRIGGRTFLINNQVNRLINVNKYKQKSYLFDLLAANSKYNESTSLNIHNILQKSGQARLIQKLKQINKIKKKYNQLQNFIMENNKKRYSVFLINQIRRKQQEGQKIEYLSCITFLRNFRVSLKQQHLVNNTISDKMQALQDHILSNKILNMLICLKQNLKLRNQEQQKSYCIMKINIFNRLKQMRTFMKQIAVKQQNYKKYGQIKGLIKSRGLKNLTYQYKYNSLCQKLNKYKKNSALNNLNSYKNQLVQLKMKSEHFINKYYEMMGHKLFFNIAQQINQIITKQNILFQKHKIHLQNKKKQFISVLKHNKSTRQSAIQLVKHKTHRHLSQLITTFYTRKYGKIKYGCSIKLYAKNLLKKSMKNFKKIHAKIRHKQNTLKLDKTTSIIAEKSIDRSFKSNSLSEQIEKFNFRKSRQIR